MSIIYQNGFPDFFTQAPTLTLFDPLSQFLGAVEQGRVTYYYQDAVKLAGHSCPTVAAAFLMTIKGLQALYGEEIPERGGIEVRFAKGRDEGTTGVTGSIITLLTGAATEMGFGGIGQNQRFVRRNLLSFSQPIEGNVVFSRKDNGKSVAVRLHLDEVVPWTEQMKTLLPKAVSGQASAEELATFAELWQLRVKQVLIDFADDPRLVEVINL
ncbi:hypothetical protein RYD26_07205 [Pasteurellaceae bacterium LIM206]|nr:hypothetical protein [Pasteurellaceae bacterium LIM206]